MKRFTKRDWQTINEALAFIEAEDLSNFEEHNPTMGDDIAAAREKVHERLDRYRNAYDDD